MRRAARAARKAWGQARFRGWSLRLATTARRAGGRLALDAPHGAMVEEPPVIRALAEGGASGTFTLRIGRDVRLGRGVVIEVWAGADNVLELGDGARVGDGVRLLLRGGQIRLGARTDVRDFSVLKSEGELVLGEQVMLSYGCVVHCRALVTVGDRATLAERVTVIDSDHRADGSDRHIYNQPLVVGEVQVGDNVFAAANVVVTRDSRVGANAVLAAGAVLTGGDYPAGWLIGGIPARPLRPLAETGADEETTP